MEFNFGFLVLAASAGMIAKLVVGRDPVKLFGVLTTSLFILSLLLSMVPLAFESDPQATQQQVNSLLERTINAIPSLIIGELAGVVAATIVGPIIRLFVRR